jgi:hypothetical protein
MNGSSFFRRHWLTALGSLLGAGIGYGYYKLVGCPNGTCMITSKPSHSMAYFAVVGAVMIQYFRKTKK